MVRYRTQVGMAGNHLQIPTPWPLRHLKHLSSLNCQVALQLIPPLKSLSWLAVNFVIMTYH